MVESTPADTPITPAPDARLISLDALPSLDGIRAGDCIICPNTWGAGTLTAAARAKGAHIIAAPYRYENTRIDKQRSRKLLTTTVTNLTAAPRGANKDDRNYANENIDAFTNHFTRTWEALQEPPDTNPTYTPVTDFVPESWAAYLPFPTYNPAQVQALPAILSHQPAMIVAPTGAGKTVLGMTAALKSIMEDGRKAAWLVPQRSLTAELDRELDTWRSKGMNVIALSGETQTDLEATKKADLWVATTEKFEALCRSASLKEAISEIGVIVVDEIHLLGEPGRGPVLETLLARIRANTDHVRLVGLSATASNATEVAEWLGATLTTITWRPTRLTQQIITLSADNSRTEATQRTEVATRIAQDITDDGGSALVFCGSKRNVRVQALAIAKARGAAVDEVGVNDAEAVYDVCASVGVGLHYSDWPYKKAAEQEFRARRSNVLVATSTLAAGVNLPARAAIVRDTTIGGGDMEVSMVQQMFGRAGRAGQESEGWAFLIATLAETYTWRRKIAAGYTIRSGILGNVEDHLLGEIVQGNIATVEDSQQWWSRTLAYHQGSQDNTHVNVARTYLVDKGFLAAGGDGTLTATPLGELTARMMIPARDAAALIEALGALPNTPGGPTVAENLLIVTLAKSVGQFTDAMGGSQPDVMAALNAVKKYSIPVSESALHAKSRAVPGWVMSAIALTLAVRNPASLHPRNNKAMGLTRTALMPAVYDSARYFSWVAQVPALVAAPAWVAPVASDVGRRVTWHSLTPPRGSGRLLWACERATRSIPERVRAMYGYAAKEGLADPARWEGADSEQLREAYLRLRDKLISYRVGRDGTISVSEHVTILRPGSDNDTLWADTSAVDASNPGRTLRADESDGAVLMARSGDYAAFGWLDVYNSIH